MRWADIGTTRCSIARALSVVGDRWTLLIVREAVLGAVRFDEFCANTGAARHIVSERLEHLVEHDVLHRVPSGRLPGRFEYHLTTKGNELYPIIAALLAWGDRWMPHERGPSLLAEHEACGHSVRAQIRCDHCDEPVELPELRHRFPATNE